METPDSRAPISKASIKKAQTGIFRSNCKGCIDRTNIAQHFIAKQISLAWMKELGFQEEENSSPFSKLVFGEDNYEESFGLQWKNNGNTISTLYGGTDSYKSELIESGRISWRGRLWDGKNRVRRFVMKNFYSGRQQVLIG